jgi:CzcA family heavy metal efflux pump
MMRWIVGSSLKFRRLVVAAALGLLLFGLTQMSKTRVDILPEFKLPQVEVQTEALGLSAAEVEQLITVPLEQDLLNGVAFLDKIESASLPGLSSVVMTFEPGTKLLDARQVVAERLSGGTGGVLPAVAKPPQMLQPLSSTSRVMMVRLSSKVLSPIELSVLTRWVISPRLLGVSGVANISVWGQRDRQLQVLVDPERLRTRGVSLQQIIRTTGNALEVSPLSFLEASSPGTGGFIDTPNQRLQIFHKQRITTAGELAQVSLEGVGGGERVPTTRGKSLRLGDVAVVVEDHQPLIGDALCPDAQCLMLVIEKFPGATTLEVTRGVDDGLDAMRPGLAGVEIDSSIYRPASYIESSVENLGWALLVGGILLIVLLGAFFFDWRTALISALAVPLSVATAALVLHLREASFNMMVLAGLVMALVIVIDDAVIDVESIGQRLRRRRLEGRGIPTWRGILEASIEMRTSILYATVIVVVALLPLFVLKGQPGAFLPPLAISYAVAILASMVVALTVTPALSMMLLANAPLERRESPVVRWLQRGYSRTASRIVPRPVPAFVAMIAVVGAAVAALPFLTHSLTPSVKETDVLVRLEAAPGTSLSRMNAIVAQAVRELRSIPEVRGVGAHVGRAVMSDQIVNVNSGEIWINVDPTADHAVTIGRIQEAVGRHREFSSRVVSYSEEQATDVLSGTTHDIVVRIYGQDDGVLGQKAQQLRNLLSSIAGVERLDVQPQANEPTIEVQVDLAKSLRYGVTPGDVRRAAATLLSGIGVGSLFEQQKVFDVVVWGTPETRDSLSDVEQLLIETPDGGHVRLGSVANVRVASNPTVIRHESVSKYLDVAVDVSGRDVGAVAGDVERAVARLDFPLEHHAEVLGEYAEHRAARMLALAVAIAAAIGIFLLLQAAFRSWRLAILVFATMPIALAGGVLACWAAGGTISLGTVAGAFVVLGIAARGSIVLIRHYQQLERHEGEPFGPMLVVRGTGDRLVPLALTALAGGLMLLPLIVVADVPGFEIVHPMAVFVLGGLLTATLLNLFLVPALYLGYGAVAELDTSADDVILPQLGSVSEPPLTDARE